MKLTMSCPCVMFYPVVYQIIMLLGNSQASSVINKVLTHYGHTSYVSLFGINHAGDKFLCYVERKYNCNVEQKLPAVHANALLVPNGWVLNYVMKFNLLMASGIWLTISHSEMDNYHLSPDFMYFNNRNMMHSRSPPPPIAVAKRAPDLALFKK